MKCVCFFFYLFIFYNEMVGSLWKSRVVAFLCVFHHRSMLPRTTEVSFMNVWIYFHQLVQPQELAKMEEDKKDVVIESGPVEYEKTDETNPVGEEEEFDELEEEDEEPVSAVQLMGHLYDASKLFSRVRITEFNLF